VTAEDREPLRIALVHQSPGSGDAAVRELETSLRAAGHGVEVLTARSAASVRLPDKVLRYRGFATPLAPVPFAVMALRRGRFDVAHAFSPQDALAARMWRRLGGGRVVFSPPEPLRRETLADRRLSLRLLEGAIEDSDAFVVLTEPGRESVMRWLALDVPLIEPGDAAGWESIYRGAA
jgi:hypothetical protein